MPYDERLANRVRAILASEPTLEERRMIGGSLGFMLRGNFCIGVHNDRLTVRVPRDQHERWLSRPSGPAPSPASREGGGEGSGRQPQVTAMTMAGKPMIGWLYVASEAVRTKRDLERWVERGRAYALSLPPKQPRKRVARRAK